LCLWIEVIQGILPKLASFHGKSLGQKSIYNTDADKPCMDDGAKVMIAIGAFLLILIIFSAKGGAPDDGRAINITGKDFPKFSFPNTSIDLPFVGKHDVVGNMSIDDVQFTTVDGVSISGTMYYPANSKPKSVAVLVHQLGSSRKAYDSLSRKLASSGVACLAIDLRGHGGSPYKGGYSSFSTEDWLSAKKDIDGAFDSLYDKAGDSKLPASVVGASIGANLALQYASEGKRNVSRAVLISPGLDFRGVTTEDAAKKYSGKTLIVVSEEDVYSFDSAKTLESDNPSIESANYTGLGHGTDMLKSDDVISKIVAWLSN
jgi:dienelactone hydrolase